MKNKFKIIDTSTGEKGGTKFHLKEGEMIVMNDQGMRGIHPILVGNFMDYDTYVRKLSDVCPKYSVVWKGEE